MAAYDEAIHVGANLLMTVTLVTAILCCARILAVTNDRINNANYKAVVDKVNCYAAYDDHTVSGDKVRGFVSNYSGDIFIRVTTSDHPAGFYGVNLLDVSNVESDYFVNPTNSFYCTLLYDQNNEVAGANFEQIGVQLTDAQIQQAIQYCESKLGGI